VPLIGCGGISSGQDAVEFAKAGATFVQLYTGLVYKGIGLPRQIKDDVAQYLKQEGKHWVDLVGSGVPKSELKLPERLQQAPPEAGRGDGLHDKELADAKRELEDIIGRLNQYEQQSSAAATAEAETAPPSSSGPAAANSTADDAHSSPALEAKAADEESRAQEEGGSGKEHVLGPLGSLFSSFGERSRSSESPKRLV
jgi:dihydroorotate dehydrogenase